MYNRPVHTRRTIDALLANHISEKFDLVIFSDGPKRSEDSTSVSEVRNLISNIVGFRSVTVKNRSLNLGLAKSIISGVSETLEDYESVIVLEDDMITSPYFLTYMSEGLKKYQNHDKVISIHGYVYPVREELPETFFLRGADCWGWATWRHGWDHFNPDGQFLLGELKRQNLINAFDFNGTYSYSGMLKGQIEGSNDSWAVRWHASAFLSNKLTLYPGRSLVHNIGNDSTGTHCSTTTSLDSELSYTPISLRNITVLESSAAKKSIENFFRAKHHPIRRFFVRFIKDIIRHQLICFVKDWMPPVLLGQLCRLLRREAEVTFDGPFASWEEAKQRSSGYDNKEILEKTLTACLKVKNGEVVYERDSVNFDKIQYSWPLATALMHTASFDKSNLSVLDFGGSLGSSYYQNNKFLHNLKSVRWSVIEQKHYVDVGIQYFKDDRLSFYYSINDCLKVESPNVILLSSVLQYLTDPYKILHELCEIGAKYIIVDLTIVNNSISDYIYLQKVPSTIYKASYPVRSLSESKLLLTVKDFGYELISDFKTLDFPQLKKIHSNFKGYIFHLIK